MNQIPPEELKRIFEVYTRPFRYDEEWQSIMDAKDRHLLDIRGWGWMQYLFPSHDAAIEIQDALGELIVKLLNDVK